MASSSADISRSQPQIIHFDHPGDLLEAARYSVEEIGPLQLDAHQRQNIRRYSKRFKRFLDIDRDRRRWESRFRDWNNRCEPHTTKMLVKMLATSNGAWPDGLPREGMQLVELYIGFQVFDCDYNLLDHSDGFKQAAKHLIFSQDPEQIARGGEVEIHALVRDVQKYICTRFNTALEYQFRALAAVAPEWAARLHTEMENAGVLHELNIISQNDVVPGYPTPLELNTKIFGVVEKLLALPVAIPRPRGARGSRGIAGAFCNVVGMMTTHRSCDDQSSVESARLEQRNEPLQEFQQDLDQAVGAIGEDAYDKFLVKLRQDWDNKAAARPYVPGATSLRRDSASGVHSVDSRRGRFTAFSSESGGEF